ncbi:hypothetical protein [Streptomyces sp. NRRL F-5630]|uniref:hypothetical protein n=1 Tax=Streptomyces sp. NRRL F-5630 TaxID=1463864 RepID=UPI003EBD448E
MTSRSRACSPTASGTSVMCRAPPHRARRFLATVRADTRARQPAPERPRPLTRHEVQRAVVDLVVRPGHDDAPWRLVAH